MSESPCPACGKPGEPIGTHGMMCSDYACSFSCDTELWRRLARAVALLGVCERLERKDGYMWAFEFTRGRPKLPGGPTLVDALIALAQE